MSPRAVNSVSLPWKALSLHPEKDKGLLSDASVGPFGQALSRCVIGFLFCSSFYCGLFFKYIRQWFLNIMLWHPRNWTLHQILKKKKWSLMQLRIHTVTKKSRFTLQRVIADQQQRKTVCSLKHVNSFFHKHIRHHSKGSNQLCLHLDTVQKGKQTAVTCCSYFYEHHEILFYYYVDGSIGLILWSPSFVWPIIPALESMLQTRKIENLQYNRKLYAFVEDLGNTHRSWLSVWLSDFDSPNIFPCRKYGVRRRLNLRMDFAPQRPFWELSSQSKFVVVQSSSHIQFCATPWTAAHQASLSFIISRSLLKLI